MVSLHCTVCSDILGGKEEWLRHLLEEEHLRKSREELLGRCFEKKYVAVLIAVFSNNPVACDELLQRFSRKVGTIVTDFVWWPEKPRLGFIQFQSRKKVKEVLKGVSNKKKIRVGDHLLQLKPATEILTLEWETLLPLTSGAYKGRSEPSIRIHEPESSFQGRKVLESNNTSLPQNSYSHQACMPATATLPVKIPSASMVFKSALTTIMKSLEVTENEYQSVQLVREELKKIFDETKKCIFSVGLIKTWSIKLKQEEKGCPFFKIQKTSRNNTFVKMANTSIMKRISKDSKSALSKKLKLPGTKSTQKRINWQKRVCVSYQIKKWDKIQLSSFKITGCSKSRHRSKIWEMMNYLCQFNPVCKPFLAVIYHWANANLIQVGQRRDDQDPKYNKSDKYFLLTLLAILFLSTEGHIPTFQEILSQTHYMDNLYCDNINIGFTQDPKFVASWMQQRDIIAADDYTDFAKFVFMIASRFFLHYGNSFVEGEWVINSETGKMFKTQEILNDLYFNLDKKDPNRIEAILLKQALTNEDAGVSSLDRLLLTHPSCIDWFLKISNDPTPFEAMQKTGVKLTNFLIRQTDESLMETLVI